MQPEDAEVYGLLGVAGVEVALPLGALREVVPCPLRFLGLPTSAPGLLGAIELRDAVVPVVDLQLLLDQAGEPAADRVIVVVVHDEHVLGVLVDVVRGIGHVPPGELQEVRIAPRAGGLPLFSHTFREDASGTVISVLDAAALLSLPGVPTVRVPDGGEPVAAGPVAVRGSRRTLTLMRCGSYVLALDVAHVHSMLPPALPSPSPLASVLCHGVRSHVDREVAVVDPLALLGLGQMPADEAGAGLVLQVTLPDGEQGYAVLAVGELLDLVEVGNDEVLPLPTFAVRRGELLHGLADLPGVGQCLVLDGAALRAEAEIVALAGLNTLTSGEPLPTGGAATTAAAAATGRQPAVLVYSAGVDVATRLDQVAEILPFPSSSTPTGVDPALLGVVAHRSAAVPMLCLPTLLGRTPAPPTEASCVLLVEVDGQPVAFAVDSLRSISPVTWTDEDAAAEPVSRERALLGSPLVGVGTQGQLLPDLDLVGLARLVRDAVPA